MKSTIDWPTLSHILRATGNGSNAAALRPPRYPTAILRLAGLLVLSMHSPGDGEARRANPPRLPDLLEEVPSPSLRPCSEGLRRLDLWLEFLQKNFLVHHFGSVSDIKIVGALLLPGRQTR